MEHTRVGPFEILGKLGTHRRHHVYRAIQVEQQRPVALKFIQLPPGVLWDSAISRIDREVRILKRLRHPNLVRTFGAGVYERQVFFATELVDGETLGALLARRGRLASDLAVDYAQQIAVALDFLHQQEILHCKLTPEKILIAPDGVVKVGDVRLNRAKRRRWDWRRHHQAETAAYQAPELLTGEGATAHSDLYSLGVILFEMLTGRLPVEPDSVSRTTRQKLKGEPPSIATYVMGCPIWLEKLVAQLLNPDPKRRPFSARAVIATLDGIRQIEAARRTATEELARGFSPLNVGMDRSEAQRVLGKKRERPRLDPTHRRIALLTIGLVVVAALLGWALTPPSSESLFRRAEGLMQSDNWRNWQRARDALEVIMARSTVDPWYEKAQDLYWESRRRSLVARLEAGLTGLETPLARRLHEAIILETAGQWVEALEQYGRLVETTATLDDQRHIWLEVTRRTTQLEQLLTLSGDLRGMLDEAMSVELSNDLVLAATIYREVVNRASTDRRLAFLVDEAQARLDHILPAIMAELEPPSPSDEEEPQDDSTIDAPINAAHTSSQNNSP